MVLDEQVCVSLLQYESHSFFWLTAKQQCTQSLCDFKQFFATGLLLTCYK